MEIEKGEFLVLLGSSGCGKSTLLNCIAGLLEITNGQIFIEGKNVTWSEPSERGIGMVFQSYALYPQMTVEGNLSFGLKNANTYDLMFGTAVGNFANYPDLLESANITYDSFRSSFSKLANDSEDVIAFKCLTLWSMVHGLVGIIRKVHVVGDDLNQTNQGPITSARIIADNLEQHLDRVLSGLIQN